MDFDDEMILVVLSNLLFEEEVFVRRIDVYVEFKNDWGFRPACPIVVLLGKGLVLFRIEKFIKELQRFDSVDFKQSIVIFQGTIGMKIPLRSFDDNFDRINGPF